MATFAKTILSGSTNGRMVKIAATSGSGTLIHTGSTTTTTFDEVWLYAVNSDTAAKKLTLQWGGTTSPDDLIELTIAAESGLVLVVPGFVLKGAATALEVRAFCETTNVVMVGGWVNQITA